MILIKSKIYFAIFLSIFIFFSIRPALAVDPKFRRPIDTILSPVFTSFYDNRDGVGLRDYNCGSNTYERHTGTDLRATVGTLIFASARGSLYYRYDGCPTYGFRGSSCGDHYGNHARIDHEGNLTDGVGWVTIYGHMQRGTVVWPQTLLCGARIGATGSSGNSDGPHLHFEVRKYSYPNNDPFSGRCSRSSMSLSWWVNQGVDGVPTTECQRL